MVGSPCPSHPTVRSVFPSTAVRQSSAQGMHRCSLGPDEATTHIEQPHGVEPPIRNALPSEPAAFTAIGQIPTSACVDKALQPAKGLAGIGVAIVIAPSPHLLVDLPNTLRRPHRSPPLGAVLNPS